MLKQEVIEFIKFAKVNKANIAKSAAVALGGIVVAMTVTYTLTHVKDLALSLMEKENSDQVG